VDGKAGLPVAVTSQGGEARHGSPPGLQQVLLSPIATLAPPSS